LSDTSTHRRIVSENLPNPIGPYSPGVVFDRLVFVSGQGAVVPGTGTLAGLDVETQTEQVFKNIAAILEAAGSSLGHVLRCGVFLADMRDFPRMNAVYERMMAGNKAARTTVQVAALPVHGLLVEIDAIAFVP
jgi:2-iminobutanoate/2-iminopropanoate deaminase